MRRVLGVMAGLVLVGSVAAASSLALASGRDEARGRVSTHGDFVRYHISEAAQEAALEYWTPARMAAAVPIEMTRLGGPVLPEAGDGSPSEAQGGSGGHIAGVAPSAAQQGSVAPRTELSTPAGGYAYPFPFSRYEIPGLDDYTSYPYSTVGKIFMTDPTGSYACSGAAVVSANESVVWTAGHCVYMIESGWFSNLIFVPAFRDNAKPFGEWVAVDAWVRGAGTTSRTVGQTPRR